MAKKMTSICIALIICFFSVSNLSAQSRQPENVVKKVRKLADTLAENKTSVEEIEWKWGEGGNYAFLIDCDNITMVNHPVKPALEGRDLSNLQDKTGSYFFLEYCTMAKDNPEKGGWVEYWWPKPGEEEPSRKISYIYSVPGENSKVICSGIYTDEFTQEELNKRLQE